MPSGAPPRACDRRAICRVTYWIAYCKVTRTADGSRLKIDGAIPNRLERVVDAVGNLEQQGYDGTVAMKECGQ